MWGREDIYKPAPSCHICGLKLQQRKSVTFAEVAGHTGTDEKAVRTMLHALVEQSSLLDLEMAGERRYRPRIAPKKDACFARISGRSWRSIRFSATGQRQQR